MAQILVVDDDKAILDMVENILNKDGHQITKVSDPEKIDVEKLQLYDAGNGWIFTVFKDQKAGGLSHFISYGKD